jgi:glucosyl-dolichyl phosphate glucuronosyltransferase
MVSDPAVTVIVCTYNRAHYLPTCLESLSRQQCDCSFEVLVVDNNSSDNTPEVLEQWCLKDARFRTTREPRVGLSAAKNTGVRLARGRLLLFTDDDVVLDRDWMRAYVDFFARRGQDSKIAGGPIVPIPHDLGQWPDWFDSCALVDLGLLDHGHERPLGIREYVWGANMAIPAVHFGRFGPWNETVGRRGDARGTFEDTEYQDRIRAAGGMTWFCPSARIQHRLPRLDITPSRVLRTAFTRGRNEFWKVVLRGRDEGTFTPRTDYLQCLGLLIRHGAAFALRSLVFSARWRKEDFVRAHASAWAYGGAMDLLRAGRESGRLSSVLGRGCMLSLESALNVLRRREQKRG